MLAPLLLALQLAVAPPAAVSPGDSTLLRVRVEVMARDLLLAFHEGWRGAQSEHPFLSSQEYVREGTERPDAVHCHWDRARNWLARHLIVGVTIAHASCPRFLPPGTI